MIENPELWADRMISCGASSITFHFEATADAEAFAHTLHKAFQTRNLGSGHVGVSIKPDTPVSALSDELLEAIDMVLIMTVEPGFGGQALLPHCIEKVRELRKDRAFAKKIQVDGGIDPENVQCLIDAGADAIVAGSSIFKSTSLADRAAAIKALRGQ
jgi:ribulose-phosphate 3-epimerase